MTSFDILFLTKAFLNITRRKIMNKSILPKWSQIFLTLLVSVTFLFGLLPVPFANADTVKIGLNYPKTGPYSVQGLDQWRAAELAVAEINAAGGILGKNVEIAWRDSQSKADLSTANVTELIDNEGVKMVLGGSSSGVAVATGKVCQAKGMTDSQGVLIPAQNLDNLMLSEEVVDAVRAGQFHVYPVSAVEEGIEILTGIPAGQPQEDGTYPEGGVFARVVERLERIREALKEEKDTKEEEEKDSSG